MSAPGMLTGYRNSNYETQALVSDDADACRLECIRHILDLQRLVKEDRP